MKRPELTRSECLGRLGLGETASPQEIRQAYHTLARMLHPDRHPEDTSGHERFAEVAEAYATLKRMGCLDAAAEKQIPRILPHEMYGSWAWSGMPQVYQEARPDILRSIAEQHRRRSTPAPAEPERRDGGGADVKPVPPPAVRSGMMNAHPDQRQPNFLSVVALLATLVLVLTLMALEWLRR